MAKWSPLNDWLKRKLVPNYDLGTNGPSPAKLLADRLASLLDYMEASGVASSKDRFGCSKDEVAILEAKYGVSLPLSYRWYLETMGHKSGRLFTHDHMAVFYRNLISLTVEYRETAAEFPNASVQLPKDAIIIASRLFEQFQFIRCNDALDSGVWYFNEWDKKIVATQKSVVDWLYTFCDEAKLAISRGYYDEFPNGTTP